MCVEGRGSRIESAGCWFVLPVVVDGKIYAGCKLGETRVEMMMMFGLWRPAAEVC